MSQTQTTLLDLPEGSPSQPEGADGAMVAGENPDPLTTAAHETAPPPVQALAVVLPAWGVGESWLAEYERMAVRIARATVLPVGLGGDARNVLAVALAGRELGIGFMEATRQIDVINGVTALRAELKMALAVRAGMVVDQVESSDAGCTITAHRSDTGTSLTVSFTEADKRRAKLGTSDRSAWGTYPEDMFYARACSRLVRRLMPDARGASFRSVEEMSEEIRPDA